MNILDQLPIDIYKRTCEKLASLTLTAAAGIPNPTAGGGATTPKMTMKMPKGGGIKPPQMSMPTINHNVSAGITQVSNNIPLSPLPTVNAMNNQNQLMGTMSPFMANR